MNIKIIRGQNQIGGSIIEISTKRTSIILDVGIELNEGRNIKTPDIEGLFQGSPKYDAVLISHYHSDHIGLLGKIIDCIPIYMGSKAYDIICAVNDYKGETVNYTPLLIYPQEMIQIGDISVTPYLCDHSAFDSYMLVLESEGRRVLYTGDFRANGRKYFPKLLNMLPEVDTLIIEGTTLSRDNGVKNIPELRLESLSEQYMKEYPGPAFVLMSSMNIDRLVTFYRSSIKAGRLFLEDIYTANIAAAINGSIPNPETFDNVRVFMTLGGDRFYNMLNRYGNAKIGRNSIAKEKFTMCVRPSMKNYLEKLSEVMDFQGGILLYSMWKGYQERENMKEFLDFMKDKNVDIKVVHTSGHADADTIDKLVRQVNPQIIIPVHTENAAWFKKYEPNIKIYLSNEETSV